ncbi:MAG: 4Fe-4S cluster-binding domain-containing protein [Defluviitaleaceae bacterium]|nr:4Fe-4S cluster-binding domain-containing protein [Defluviitaleaceae bacterium]
MKKTFDYLEVKITEHCNMQCNACSNMGNISNKEEYGLQYYSNDFNRMADLDISINKIRLLGGEPFLCDNLIEYVRISRLFNPSSKIAIVTNGVDIYKRKACFFKELKKLNIEIHITIYPKEANARKIERGINELRLHGLNYKTEEKNMFEVDLTLDSSHDDVSKTFEICRGIYDCVNLYRGFIYHCTKPISYKHFDKKFMTHISSNTSGFNIYDDIVTSDTIAAYLSSPNSICKYCTFPKRMIPWGEGCKEQEIWYNNDSNSVIISNMNENEKKLYFEDVFCFVYRLKNKELLKLNINKLLNDCKHDVLYLWCFDKYSINKLYFLNEVLDDNIYKKIIIADRSIHSLINIKICIIDSVPDGIAAGCVLFISHDIKTMYSAIRRIKKVEINE